MLSEPIQVTFGFVKTQVGPTVTAQLTYPGKSTVQTGMPVEMVTRKIRADREEKGTLVNGDKFWPMLNH